MTTVKEKNLKDKLKVQETGDEEKCDVVMARWWLQHQRCDRLRVAGEDDFSDELHNSIAFLQGPGYIAER